MTSTLCIAKLRPLLLTISIIALLASACGSTATTIESGGQTSTIPDTQRPESGEPESSEPEPGEPETTEQGTPEVEPTVPDTTVPETSEPDDPALLLGGGSSFGECAGFCLTKLSLDGADVVVTQSTWGDQPDHVITGALSDAGLSASLKAGAFLTNADLDEVYGCPGCADGGAEWVSFLPTQSPEVKSTFEYGNPPEELASASSLVRSLIEAMQDCETTDLVTVSDDCTVATN